ncbi:hypothetical protein MKX01_018273, partial [Papaver californicum]
FLSQKGNMVSEYQGKGKFLGVANSSSPDMSNWNDLVDEWVDSNTHGGGASAVISNFINLYRYLFQK